MADDEYFRRLTPRPEEPRKSGETNTLGRKASSTLMALDTVVDPEEEQAVMAAQQEVSSSDDEIVRTVPGRQRTIIHRQPRVKSTEGLLSFYTNEKPLASEPTTAQATEPHTPESPTSDTEPAMVQRAKSVELGKNHVRHLSAGSARLLDISKQKRSSVQSHSKKSEVDQ